MSKKAGVKGAGSETDAIKAGVAKVSVGDKKKHTRAEEEEEDDESEEEGDDDEDEEEGDDLQDLPKKVLKRVVAIRKIHNSVEEIDLEYKKERIALEQKYLALKQPLYEARNQIISGEVEAPVDESTPDEASENADEDEEDEEIVGIPGFWLQCLGAHHVTGDLISEEDVPALEALTSIKVDYDETFSSFTLTFAFEENEYFTNKTLTKKYGVSPDLLDEKAPALTSNEGTEIDWKPSKNLTVTEIKKKQKAKSGRNKGQVRTITETVPKASFFHFFASPTGDEEDEGADDDEDNEEGHNRIKLTMEEDYDVGHTIRTAIIPEAVLWYTGEAVDDEYDEDEDGMYGGEDDEDEEDDDDDEDDDNKKTKLVANAEGGFAAPGAPVAGGEQPECKQN